MLVRDEGELAERVSTPSHRERRRVAEWRRDPYREPPARDQVEGIAGIAAVEDDLAAGERAPPRDREHGADGVLWHLGEERPLHGCVSRV